MVHRNQLAIRKQAQQASLGPPRDAAALMDELLDRWVVYRCVSGSRAYGLDDDDSDVDVRGVFLAPPEMLWSLRGAPDYLERGAMDEAYWELAKFCVLALKANPNVLECLNTPLVQQVTPIGQELLGLRDAFLSRLVHQTYNGYVLSQFKKLEGDLRSKGAPKWKHVMHLIRLLLSGISVLREGAVTVDVGAKTRATMSLSSALPMFSLSMSASATASRSHSSVPTGGTPVPIRPDPCE